MTKLTIILADDHPLIREGLANIINKQKNFRVVAEADNGISAYDLIKLNVPDICILDIEMPGLNGLELCKKLKETGVKSKVLFLTMLKERSLYKKSFAVGADGYLLKDNALKELINALETISKGEFYLSEEINKLLVDAKSPILMKSELNDVIKKLSKTEKNLLLLIAERLSSKEISKKLFVSENTVKKHRQNIIKKLELDADQNSLLKFAIENRDYLK
jgi:DNA-binding NarL/FixJ family response regulator